MTSEKKEERDRVRFALFQAALRLAAAHGFSALSLREVAREAGIAPTSFYRHFSDMEQLGTALIEERIGGLLREVDAAMLHAGKQTPHAAGRTFIHALFRLADREPELVRFVVAERVGGVASSRGAIRRQIDGLARPLEQLLCETCPAEQGSAAAEAIVTLALDACFQALDGLPAMRVQQLNRILVKMDLLLHGIGIVATPPAGPVENRPPAQLQGDP